MRMALAGLAALAVAMGLDAGFAGALLFACAVLVAGAALLLRPRRGPLTRLRGRPLP